MRTCPQCRAGNAEGAAWCSQCYASLDEPVREQPAPPSEEGVAAEPTPAAPPIAGDPAPSTGLRRGEDGLEWICVACESVNPMESDACATCGTPFVARFAVAERAEPVDWSRARSASLLLPGLGHISAGRGATGWARALLFVVWALGGLLILAGAGTAGLLVAGPLLLGAAVVYVVTQADLRAAEHSGREILAGRTLLWLVVGVTVLVILGAVVGLGSAVTGGA